MPGLPFRFIPLPDGTIANSNVCSKTKSSIMFSQSPRFSPPHALGQPPYRQHMHPRPLTKVLRPLKCLVQYKLTRATRRVYPPSQRLHDLWLSFNGRHSRQGQRHHPRHGLPLTSALRRSRAFVRQRRRRRFLRATASCGRDEVAV